MGGWCSGHIYSSSIVRIPFRPLSWHRKYSAPLIGRIISIHPRPVHKKSHAVDAHLVIINTNVEFPLPPFCLSFSFSLPHSVWFQSSTQRSHFGSLRKLNQQPFISGGNNPLIAPIVRTSSRTLFSEVKGS